MRLTGIFIYPIKATCAISVPQAEVQPRGLAGDRRWVVVNFRGEPEPLDLDADLSVEVASDGAGEGQPFRGRVGADQALILA